MNQINIIILLSAIVAFAVACESDMNSEIEQADLYSLDDSKILSEYLDIPDLPYSYSFGNLEAGIETDHIATLGRVLFYDKDLSATKKVSCASCHEQSLAFADDSALSVGDHDNMTHRNSIALGSFRSFGRQYDNTSNSKSKTAGLFWDERTTSIKEQLKETIKNPNEMGMELNDIVDNLNEKEYYQVLSQKAYSSSKITEDNVLEALEVFMNSISSVNTVLETEVFGELNYITGDSVVGKIKNDLGLQLFVHNCGSCHRSNIDFVDDQSTGINATVANNGLSLHPGDKGLFQHTQDAKDIGKFKIPGLLNVELSAPYMHDGRFATLEEVVDFYDAGIEMNDNLHPSLMKGNAVKRMQMSQVEKTALVDFLKLLTDQNITEEVKWSSPFLY